MEWNKEEVESFCNSTRIYKLAGSFAVKHRVQGIDLEEYVQMLVAEIWFSRDKYDNRRASFPTFCYWRFMKAKAKYISHCTHDAVQQGVFESDMAHDIAYDDDDTDGISDKYASQIVSDDNPEGNAEDNDLLSRVDTFTKLVAIGYKKKEARAILRGRQSHLK